MGFDGLDFDGVDSTMAIIWISIQIEGFQFKGFDHGDGCIGFRFEGFDGWISMGSMDLIPSNSIMAIPFQIRPWPSAGLRFRPSHSDGFDSDSMQFRFDAIPILQFRFESNHSCIQPLLPFFDSDRSIPTVLIPTRCNSDSNHSCLFPCSSHEYFDIVIHSICAHKKGPIFDTIISAHKKGAHTIIFDTTTLTTSYQ